MKDKLKPIDVSILSPFMGRSLTAVLTIFVVSVAVSAYVSGGRGSRKNVICVCVPAKMVGGELLLAFEPFAELMSRETGRPVVLSECGEQRLRGFDLYVMPIHGYLRHEIELDISALHEIRSAERQNDKAVIISRTPDHEVGFADTSPAEVVFSHPLSVNGFWVQAAAMKRRGFGIPDDPRKLRFEGSVGGGERVIFGVLYDVYSLGACKLSELTALVHEETVRAEELHVVHGEDVLPEWVIAARSDQSDYYGPKIDAVARLLDEATSPATEDETVRLLKSLGVGRLVRVDTESMAKTRGLFEEFGDLFDSTRVVRP